LTVKSSSKITSIWVTKLTWMAIGERIIFAMRSRCHCAIWNLHKILLKVGIEISLLLIKSPSCSLVKHSNRCTLELTDTLCNCDGGLRTIGGCAHSVAITPSLRVEKSFWKSEDFIWCLVSRELLIFQKMNRRWRDRCSCVRFKYVCCYSRCMMM
jgi:hypothetical protein